MEDATELQRRASEARHYLRQGYTDRASVAMLMERIRKNRGQEAADQLLTDMREQWRKRRQWLGGHS